MYGRSYTGVHHMTLSHNMFKRLEEAGGTDFCCALQFYCDSNRQTTGKEVMDYCHIKECCRQSLLFEETETEIKQKPCMPCMCCDSCMASCKCESWWCKLYQKCHSLYVAIYQCTITQSCKGTCTQECMKPANALLVYSIHNFNQCKSAKCTLYCIIDYCVKFSRFS